MSKKPVKKPVKKAAKPVAKKPVKAAPAKKAAKPAKKVAVVAKSKTPVTNKKNDKQNFKKASSQVVKSKAIKGAQSKKSAPPPHKKVVVKGGKTGKVAAKIQASVQKKLEQDKNKKVVQKPISKKELKLLEKQKKAEEAKKKSKKSESEENDIVDQLMKKKGAVEAIKEDIVDEVNGLAEEYAIKEIFEAIKSLDYFKSEGDDCLEKGCDNPATTLGFCRYHYIKGWKDIQKKKIILSEGRLQALIEELAQKYPLRFIQAILDDLIDEKAFHGVLTELNIESDEFDDVDDEADDDDMDIAMETKSVGKTSFDEDI